MATAMEARCYVSGSSRTRFVQLHAHPVDFAVTFGLLIFVVAVWFYTDPLLQQLIARITPA